MASTPLTKDLFHKAICMSGTMLNNWAITPQNDHAYRLAKYNGYEGENIDLDVVEFLQKLDPHKLVVHDILTEEEKRNEVQFTFGPCIETYVGEDCVVPEDPKEMLKSAWGNKIPIIIGGTEDEGYLMYPKFKMFPQAMDAINNDLERFLPAEVRENDKEKSLLKAKRLVKAHFGNKIPSTECLKEFFDVRIYSSKYKGRSFI